MVATIQRDLQEFNLSVPLEYDAPLDRYTTFAVGGAAEVLARPRTPAQVRETITAAHELDRPLWVLGGGANVVVSDNGLPGIVLYTGDLRDIHHRDGVLFTAAGNPISEVAAYAADRELQGLEFIYAMPGSVGGAIWMNARCYGGEIAPVLRTVDYVDRRGNAGRYTVDPRDFDYKVSPFQDGERIIVGAEFTLHRQPGARDTLWRGMQEIEEDRRAKGHFTWPCAGSIFKNNRAFGEPSGRIIDRLGLRGLRHGGASVSPQHGNIIINDRGASASDIRALVDIVQRRVADETGYQLEPEVLFVGDWE